MEDLIVLKVFEDIFCCLMLWWERGIEIVVYYVYLFGYMFVVFCFRVISDIREGKWLLIIFCFNY